MKSLFSCCYTSKGAVPPAETKAASDPNPPVLFSVAERVTQYDTHTAPVTPVDKPATPVTKPPAPVTFWSRELVDGYDTYTAPAPCTIARVKIGTMCFLTLPCTHMVIIENKDGSKTGPQEMHAVAINKLLDSICFIDDHFKDQKFQMHNGRACYLSTSIFGGPLYTPMEQGPPRPGLR